LHINCTTFNELFQSHVAQRQLQLQQQLQLQLQLQQRHPRNEYVDTNVTAFWMPQLTGDATEAGLLYATSSVS